MFDEICALLDDGGIVECFLSNEDGVRIDPMKPGSLSCEEDPSHREEVLVTLPDGSEAYLQKVTIVKKGYVVVTVTNQTQECISDPIPFSFLETVLLCAPSGTEVRCKVVDFKCRAKVVCQNGMFVNLFLMIDTCQDVFVVDEVFLEVDGRYCKPRPIIPYEPQCFPPHTDRVKEVGHMKEVACLTSDHLPPKNSHCTLTTEVFDWIRLVHSETIRKENTQVNFTCSACELSLFVPDVIDCDGGTLNGRVLCGGMPRSGVLVEFITAPEGIVTIPSAVTDANGDYFSSITPNGTSTTPVTVSIQARAVVDGQNLIATGNTLVDCTVQTCSVGAEVVGPLNCEAGRIIGSVIANGAGVPGAIVSFQEVTNPPVGLVFTPSEVTTDPFGNYSSENIEVPVGTTPTEVTILVTASLDDGTKCGETTVRTTAECSSTECSLQLFGPRIESCQSFVRGTLFCGTEPQVGRVVTLISSDPDLVILESPEVVVNEIGEFTSQLEILDPTYVGPITITATSPLGEASVTISINCEDTCDLFVTFPEQIDCEGGVVEGSLMCEGPINETQITFEQFPPVIDGLNPILIQEGEPFSIPVTVIEGTPLTGVEVYATVDIEGQPLTVAGYIFVQC